MDVDILQQWQLDVYILTSPNPSRPLLLPTRNQNFLRGIRRRHRLATAAAYLCRPGRSIQLTPLNFIGRVPDRRAMEWVFSFFVLATGQSLIEEQDLLRRYP